MKISTKGRYALRLMIDIAMHGTDENVSIRDVAARQDISIKYLEQIVSMLVRVGYLRSIRGAQGGYRLAKTPAEYTVGDILRITEGSLAPVTCLEDGQDSCERASKCVTKKLWKGLYEAVNNYVDSVTLEDLINDTIEGNEAVDFCI